MDAYLIEACEILEQVSKTRSSKEKQRLLNSVRGETREILKDILKIACDWYLHYGIQELPEATSHHSKDMTFADFKELAESLRNKICTYSKQDVANFLSSYSPVVSKWLTRALLKDLRAGIAATTINKVFPKLCDTFSCQLADTCESVEDVTFPCFVQTKIDGVRCIAIVSNGDVKFISRTGSPLFNCEEIEEEIKRNNFLNQSYVLDGELYAGTLQHTLSVVRSSVNTPDPNLLAQLKFYCFDMMSYNEWNEMQCKVPLYERVQILNETHSCGDKLQILPVVLVEKLSELVEFYNQQLEAGYEGVIVKKIEGHYTFTRTPVWLKLKPSETAEFVVTETYPGTGKHEGKLGGVVIHLGNNVYNRVGGGFSDYERELYHTHPELIVGKSIEVRFKMTTEDQKLREPVFIRIREE